MSQSADARPMRVAEQFADADQQHQARAMGMWLFLSTEIMLFGGIFAAWTVYRYLYGTDWIAASRHLNVTLGTINTAVLLTSSLTMALAVHAAKSDNRRQLYIHTALTALLGIAFLAIKGYEYHEEAAEGLMPIAGFASGSSLHGDPQELFMNLYFVATIIHAIHLALAILLVLGLAAWVRRSGLSPNRAETVETAGLFWHLVDCVWIFLYPILYLVR